jgi:hypothetical protein
MDCLTKREIQEQVQCKVKNTKEYQQQLLVEEKFLEPKRMQVIYHKFCNHKTEEIHGMVINVAMPKQSYFCNYHPSHVFISWGTTKSCFHHIQHSKQMAFDFADWCH